MMLPWFKVHALAIESFRREGEKTTIGFEGTSRIDIDWESKTYSVRVDGVEIARDGNTFCPIDEGRIAFYSLTGGDITTPLPKGWDAAGLAAVALSIDKPEEVKVAVRNGKVAVNAAAQQPVMVYRDAAQARETLLRRG